MTVYETKQAKVTVVTAKPCNLPNLTPNTATPKATVPRSNGPSYSDAFASFLTRKTIAQTEAEAEKSTSKVAVEPANPLRQIFPKSPPATPKKITVVQKKQEAWTLKVLQQTHSQRKKQDTSTQRVKTERIYPYGTLEKPLLTNPIQTQQQGQVFYKIVNSKGNPTLSAQPCLKGNEQKQQSC